MRRSLFLAPVPALLVSAFSILTVLAANVGQVRPTIVYRPLIVAVLMTLVTFVILRALVKDDYRAGLLTALGAILFYSYGHMYNWLRQIDSAGATLGRHRYLVPAWLILAAMSVRLGFSQADRIDLWMRGMSYALVVASLLPVGQIMAAGLHAGIQAREVSQASGSPLDVNPGDIDGIALPDVYYIVLDAYGRADTLENSFGYDNHSFLTVLSELGFFVATCSQANYAQTELSLAASLNASYLEDLIDGGLQERQQLWPLIRGSAVRRSLEASGYETIAFETGYYWSEWEDADLYLAPGRGILASMTAFEGTLLRSTFAWAILDNAPFLSELVLQSVDRSANTHRGRVLFVLDELARLPGRPGPKFVFVHLVSPHRPFVFDSQGNPVSDDYDWGRSALGLSAYVAGYREQVSYLNARLSEVLAKIVADSDPAPVIILQSDHGPEEGSSQDRMRILNAYYFPDGLGEGRLYRSITPVNTFRVLFASLEGGEPTLLEDRSLFSTYQDPFAFMEIPVECPKS